MNSRFRCEFTTNRQKDKNEIQEFAFIFVTQEQQTMAKIYVASSWRNQYFPEVVKRLREYGHEVYDFRNPPHNHGAFMWKNIDPQFEKWTVSDYKTGLEHPSSERQFQADLDALNWADTCILVLPCGRRPIPKPAG